MADQFSSAPFIYPQGSFYADLNKRIETLEAALGTGAGSVPDYSITTFKLADESVTTGKLAKAAVTLEKLASEIKEQLGGVPIGTIIDLYGDGTQIPVGYLKVIPGLEVTSAYPELRAWAITNGWSVNASGNPVFPSTDDALFKRQWRAGQTLRDGGRAFGTVQQDAFQGHGHVLDQVSNGAAGGNASNPGGSGAPLTNKVKEAVSDGVNGIPRTASETRPANITVTWCIKAYNAPIDAATLTAAQVVSDVAEAKSRSALLGIKHGATVVNPNTAAVLFAGIPAGVKRVSAHFVSWSVSATSLSMVRLGSGGSIQTSGYTSPVSATNGSSALITSGDSTGVIFYPSATGSNFSGHVIFERLAPNLNLWTFEGVASFNSTIQTWCSGTVVMSGELDRLQFTTGAGSALLNGTMNVSWEF